MKVGGEQEEEKSWRIVQVVHVEVATNARKLVLKAGINEAFFRPPVVLEHEGDPSACTACMHVRIVRVGVGVGTFFGKRRERKKGNKERSQNIIHTRNAGCMHTSAWRRKHGCPIKVSVTHKERRSTAVPLGKCDEEREDD